jgi:hypothetical protein
MNHHDIINAILLSVQGFFIWMHFEVAERFAKFGCTCLVAVSTIMIIIINWEKFIEKSKKIISKWKK